MSDVGDRDDKDRAGPERQALAGHERNASRTGRRESATDKRRKELANERFQREELGELLKLFSSLGITLAFGIVAFFLLGVWLDRRLPAWGYETRGLGRIVCLLFGLGMSVYWSYLRIARHLKKFDQGDKPDAKKTGDKDKGGEDRIK